MSGGVSNRSEYINQLRDLLPASEFAQLNLDELTDAQLQERLNQALNGDGNWGEFDVIEINNPVATSDITDVEADSDGLTQKIYTNPDGDEVIEKYEGEEQTLETLKEKIIKHTDSDNNIIETVIAYSNGKMTSKTVKNSKDNTETVITYDENEEPKEKEVKNQNGIVIETTTYEKQEVEGQGTVVVANTERKSDDGATTTSTVRTLSKVVDENGNYTDEDFIERATSIQSEGKYTILRAENGNIKQISNDRNGVIVINYDGNSITSFDNGELNEVDRRTVLEANPDATEFGEVEVGDFLTSPISSSLGQVARYMRSVIDGNTPDNFTYDRATLRNLFAELESPNCKYQKISDNPLRYQITELSDDGVEIFSQEVYVGKDITRLKQAGSFREGRDDAEYIIFMNDQNVEKSYRFKADGTLLCVSVINRNNPQVETDYYPNGEIIQYQKDEHNRVTRSAYFDNNRRLVVEQNYVYNGEGRSDIEYVTKTYTENYPRENMRNRMEIIYDSSSVSPERPYDVLTYKFEKMEDYNPDTMDRPENMEVKDDLGNVVGMYVYQSMRIPENVPIVFDNIIDNTRDITGARPRTSLTVDYQGYITQRSLYNNLNQNLNPYEHCDTREFDRQTKTVTMATVINQLENIKAVLENIDANRSWIDASAWVNQVNALFGGNTTQQNIAVIEKYIGLARSLGEFAQDGDMAKLDSAIAQLCSSSPDAQQRFDDSQHLSGFERGYYILTGSSFRNQEEQFIRYNQKETTVDNNLRLLYENYKQNNSLSPKERDLFIEISGSGADRWSDDFRAFISEIDNIKESQNLTDMSQFSFVNTSVGSKYLANQTEGIFRNSSMTREMRIIQNSENDKETLGTILDLAGMALEFGAIAKGLNWAIKGTKALTIAKSARLTRYAATAGEFLSSEGQLARGLNFASRVTTRATIGGLNFAAYDMAHEAGRQLYHNEDFQGWSILHRGLVGFETGAAAGVLSTFVSEPLVRYINRPGNADVVDAVGRRLESVGEGTVRGTELVDAIADARMAAYTADASTVRGAVAKGVGFLTEVGTFTFASSTINIFDGVEIKESLLSSGKYTEEQIDSMSNTELMRAMLDMQGIKTKGLSDTEVVYEYAKNEYKNQFVGLGKLKLTEQVLGMFLSKGKLPSGASYGARLKGLEFARNERGRWYEVSDPSRTELPDAVVASRIEQAMTFDALDARLQNRFNNYHNRAMTGKEFTEMLYGEQESNPDNKVNTELADRMTIAVTRNGYEVTTVDGKKHKVDNVEGVLDIYMEQLYTQQVLDAAHVGSVPATHGSDAITLDEPEQPSFEEYQTQAQQNGTNYEVYTDAMGNKLVVTVSSEVSALGVTISKKLNISKYSPDGKLIESRTDVPESEVRENYQSFYGAGATRQTVDNSRAGVLYGGVPVATERQQRPVSTLQPTPQDPFALHSTFESTELAQKGNTLLHVVDGKTVLTEEGSELVRRIAQQLHDVSAEQEGDIVNLMIKMGLGTEATLSHRSKSVQSLYDKIQNALIEKPGRTLEDAVQSVKDGVGVRTVDEIGHFADDPQVQALLAKGDRQSAIQKAAELESEYICSALERYIDSVADGTAQVRITRISNYMGKDGVPYFTDAQLARLKAYAASKGVSLPVIERVSSFTERADAGVYNPKASTKVRGSGYTALQMNFETADGFTYEWQYRGAKLNEFAEGEHIPYDLRTNKDIIGNHTELTDLYAPMQELLSRDNISDDLYEEYNQYLTAHYEYLRCVELGFTDAQPPKLPKGLDARLRAENLELLHRTAEKIKDNPERKDEFLAEYNRELVQNTPENTTSESYVRQSRIRDLNRTIDQNEAEARLGARGENPDRALISRLIDLCRVENGKISEKLVAEVEQLNAQGVSEGKIKELLTQVQNGSYYSVASKFNELKSQHPDKTADEIADMMLPNAERFREFMSGLTMMDRPRFTDEQLNELQELYQEYGDVIETLVKTTRKFGSRDLPVYTNEQIMSISKSLRGNSELVKELVNAKKTDPTGKEIPRYTAKEITEILETLNQHPYPEQLGRFIKEHVLTDPDMNGQDIKEHIAKVVQHSSDMLPEDIPIISRICKAVRVDELLDIYKNALSQKERDILIEFANNNPEVFNKYAIGIFSMRGVSKLPITKDLATRIEFLENQEILKQFSETDRANLLMCSQAQLENGIHYLERMQEKNPDLTYEQKLEIVELEQKITANNPDLEIDVRAMVDKGFIDDFYRLSANASRGMMETPLSIRDFVMSLNSDVDPEIFKKNVDYILREQQSSIETNGQTTRFERLQDITNILKYNVDYEVRKEQVKEMSSDPDIQEILLRTENISRPAIVENITILKEHLENMGIDIDNPIEISNFLNRNPRLNLAEFNEYVGQININELRELAPRMRNYTDTEMMGFLEYHFKKGKRTEFDADSLRLREDFTQFLTDNYVDADEMDKILTAFPLTNRNVGYLPEGWLSNVPVSEQPNVESRIQDMIDTFNNEVSRAGTTNNEYTRILMNSAISKFQRGMSEALGKPVQVENLGFGSYGTGFKVSVEGSTDVVLKIFHKSEECPNSLHGRRIETQLGLYLNQNRNNYAHMYFGRVAGARDTDGYLVTQYLADGVTPQLSQHGNAVLATSYDAIGTHNRIKLDVNGQTKEVDFDYGKVVIRDKSGNDIRYRLDNE